MADDDTTELARALAATDRITTLVGTMVRLDGVRALVDVGGGRDVPATLFGRIPRPNDTVHVWFVNGKPFVMGPSALQPFNGVVVTANDDTATVTTEQGDYSGVPFFADALSSGDLVGLAWGESGPYVIGVSSLTPEPPEVRPDVPASATQRTEIFSATGSGSAANGSAFRSANGVVYASASQVGIYAYGSKVRDSLTGAASIDRVEIYLSATRDSGNLPLLGRHPLEAVAGTTPPITALRSLARPFNRWVDITDLGGALAAGGGIGFDGAGFAIFTGIGTDPNQAGALRITYTK